MPSPRRISGRSQQTLISFTVPRSASQNVGLINSINSVQDTFYANAERHIGFLQRLLSKEHEQSVTHLRALLQKLQEENTEFRKRLDLSLTSGRMQKTPVFGGMAASPDFSYWNRELHSQRATAASLTDDEDFRYASRKVHLPSRLANDLSMPIAEKDEDILDSKSMHSMQRSSLAKAETDEMTASGFGASSNEFRLRPAWQNEEQMSKADKMTERVADWSENHMNESIGMIVTVAGYKHSITNIIKYPFGVLSPHSPFLIFWNIFFMVVLGYELIMTPMAAFDMHDKGLYAVAAMTCMLFWSVDLPLTMNTALFTTKGEIVADRGTIVKNYAKGWLLPDLLLVSIDWLEYTGIASASAGGMLRGGKAVKAFRVLRVLRMLRMRKLREVLQRFDEFVNSQYFTIVTSMIMNVAAILLISHFLGCLWFLVGSISVPGYPSWVQVYHFEDRDWEYQYLTSLHWSITQFTPGSMHVQPQNILERGFAVFVLVAGMIIFSSIVSSITAATNGLKSMNSRYKNEIWRMRRFCKENGISQDLLQQIMRYSECFIAPKMAKVHIHDVDLLLSYLPRKMHMQVMLEMYGRHLEVHPLFKKLRIKDALADVCTSCVDEVVVDDGDTLFVSSTQAHSMHFVIHGRMWYQVILGMHYGEKNGENSDDRRTEFLEVGAYIAEAVLWTQWVYQGMCNASGSASTILNVRAALFQETLAEHRMEFMMARRYAIAFVRALNEMSGYDTVDEDDDCNLPDVLPPHPALEKALSTLDENRAKHRTGSQRFGAHGSQMNGTPNSFPKPCISNGNGKDS